MGFFKTIIFVFLFFLSMLLFCASHVKGGDVAELALLEMGDGRAATAELLRAAARRGGKEHREWKERAIASRPDMTTVLEELKDSECVRERTLALAMLVEAEHPGQAEKCRQAFYEAASHLSMYKVIRISMVEGNGRSIGRGLDETVLPVAEAVCLFDSAFLPRAIAAFALAEFGHERSMHVLAGSLNMGFLDGSNPAALALADFGEKGLELASKIPAPKPGEHDTGFRMLRHRSAVSALAEKGDIRGVDEIISGLEALEEDMSLDGWNHRMGIYLAAAGKYDDEKLIEPLFRILKGRDIQRIRHHNKAASLLLAYEDEIVNGRIVRILTERLGESRSSRLYETSITELARIFRGDIGEYLVEQLEKSGDDRFRANCLAALAELSYPFRPPPPAKRRWPQLSHPHFRAEDAYAYAERVRALAFPVLKEALNNESDTVSRAAAFAMAVYAAGSEHQSVEPDARAVEPLTEWCRRKGETMDAINRFLGFHGHEESGEVLLGILDGYSPWDRPASLASAVGRLKPEGAAPVLFRMARGRTRYFGGRWVRSTDLEALAALGRDGEGKLLRVLNEFDDLVFRVEAARYLGEARCEEAARPVEKLLKSLVEAGPESPGVMPGYGEGDDAYTNSCVTLLKALLRLDPDAAMLAGREILRSGPDVLKPATLRIMTESAEKREIQSMPN